MGLNVALDTNYWDIAVLTASALAFGVGAVDGLKSLAEDPDCDAPPNTTLAVCCSRSAPTRLLPIVAVLMAVLMDLFVAIRRLFVASNIHSFRTDVHVLAKSDESTSEISESRVFRSTFLRVDELADGIGFEGTQSAITNLISLAGVQILFGLLVLPIALGVVCWYMGSLVIVGSSGHAAEDDYYRFACTSDNCPLLTSDIECRIKVENVGVFWSLFVAIFLNFFGSWKFLRFLNGLRTSLKNSVNFDGFAVTLMKFAGGDGRNLAFRVYMEEYNESRSWKTLRGYTEKLGTFSDDNTELKKLNDDLCRTEHKLKDKSEGSTKRQNSTISKSTSSTEAHLDAMRTSRKLAGDHIARERPSRCAAPTRVRKRAGRERRGKLGE
jgi:hypothetical protein